MADPHAEPLKVTDADGLRLPESYIGHEGGLVARMPNGGTIDAKPREWGDLHPSVLPRHFGQDGDANDHLDVDQVGLKRYGEPEETFRVLLPDADAGGASPDGVERLDEVGPYEDPDLTEMNFECPGCGFSIAELTDCPECGWYDEAVWEETMQHYSECRECGQTIGGGSICDDCDTLEVDA